MSSILDQAEARITDVKTDTQSAQTQQIEAMREEIGHAVYQQAKAQLPEIERAIRHTYRPFLTQMQAIAAKAKGDVPAQVQGWLTEMDTLCTNIPRQVREGLDSWDTLVPPIWTDGKSLNLSVRAALVHRIRVQLKSWDGCLSALKTLTGRVETFIAQSGWPSN